MGEKMVQPHGTSPTTSGMKRPSRLRLRHRISPSRASSRASRRSSRSKSSPSYGGRTPRRQALWRETARPFPRSCSCSSRTSRPSSSASSATTRPAFGGRRPSSMSSSLPISWSLSARSTLSRSSRRSTCKRRHRSRLTTRRLQSRLGGEGHQPPLSAARREARGGEAHASHGYD